MSDKGQISKQDVAKFVVDATEGKTEPGEGIASGVAGANVVWSVWTALGEAQTDAEGEISESEADQILSQMPLEYDDVSGGGEGGLWR